MWPWFSGQRQYRDFPLFSSSSLRASGLMVFSLSVIKTAEDPQRLSSLLMPHTFSWHFTWSQGKIPAEISFSIISWQMALLAKALILRSALIGFYPPTSPPHRFYFLIARWLMPQCPNRPEGHCPVVFLPANLLLWFWFQYICKASFLFFFIIFLLLYPEAVGKKPQVFTLKHKLNKYRTVQIQIK